MSEVKVYTITTDLTVEDKKVYAASITYNQAINSYNSAELVHFNGPTADKTAIKASDKAVFDELAKRQRNQFGQRKGPDALLGLNINELGIIVFSGYVSNTTYSFSPYVISYRSNMIDEFALVDSIDCSIYGASTFADVSEEANTEYIYGKPPAENNWSIPKCLISIMEDMLQKGPEHWDGNEDMPEEETKARNRQHQLNKKAFEKYVKPLLERSEETFGWKDRLQSMSGDCNNLDQDIMLMLLNRLMEASGHFMTVLLSICEEFGCVLCPGPAIMPWDYYIISRERIMEQEEQVQLKVSSMHMSIGCETGTFPILYAAVIDKAGVGDTSAENRVNNLPWMCYPEEGPDKASEAGGSVLRVMPPSWYRDAPESIDLPRDGSIEKETEEVDEGAVDKANDKLKQARKTYVDARVTFMKDWARINYLWHALAESTAEVTCPLTDDGVISVGKRYLVMDNQGVPLFRGFCSAVSCSVVSQGQQQALMQITFTHVECGDFRLEN